MSPGGDQHVAERPIEAFISYCPADEGWAAWIAWQLDAAGHRTLLQAWDIDRSTSLADFAQRALQQAAVTVAVLSRAYLTSPQMAPERQLALRGDVGRLVTVRVEDCPRDGVPDGATHLDLSRVSDTRTAEGMLWSRLRPVLVARHEAHGGNGSARVQAPRVAGGHPVGPHRGWVSDTPFARRRPHTAPPYPPALRASRASRTGVSILHVPGPRFGRGMLEPDEPAKPDELLDRVVGNVHRLTDARVPAPDLLVVTGDLTETAHQRQMDDAWSFLIGLRVRLGLDAQRLIMVPGGRDVSKKLCSAYFDYCDARDTTPEPPYFPKLELYRELFADLYRGLDQPQFDRAQPWTLFEVPELRVACAALNSTMAITHRREDDYGQIGPRQASWFADELRRYEDRGWLRIGVVRHDPLPGSLGAEEPETMRDAAVLAEVLGTRLNLLLHGPGPGGGRVEPLRSGMQVLPGESGERYRLARDEIVHVSSDGLRRYSIYHDDPDSPDDPGSRYRFEVVTTTWRAAAAAFNPRSPANAAGGTRTAELGHAEDQHGQLLERIAAICAMRWPDAWVDRRHASRPPELMLTRQEGTRTEQIRIGAHVGELTAGVLEDFLQYDHLPGAELVYFGRPPTDDLRRMAQERGARLRHFTDFQDQLDLSQYVDGQTRRLRRDPAYPPKLYVPQRFRELGRDQPRPSTDLVEELLGMLRADEGCFVLLLGDFGRGKSFALREVARRLGESDPGLLGSGHRLTPILINLATLDRSQSFEGLISAHLANHGEERIDLRALRYMLDEGRLVLLFDGFDELVSRISYDRATAHLQKLLDAARARAKIVVAGRTQHFRSDDQVFSALGDQVGGMANRRILNVEEFTPAQVRGYLVNRHGDERRGHERYELLSGAGDLLGLAHNPRMLSFIAELDDEHLATAARHRDTLSPAGLYGTVLDSWMAHEARRAAIGQDEGPPLDTDTMWTALTELAVRLWESGEPYLRPGELAEVTEALTGLADPQLTPEEREHAVGSGSLLVRTENGLFGFIHRSVMEWLVAKAVAAELVRDIERPTLLARRVLSQLTVDFLCDVADPRACARWAAQVLDDPAAGGVSRENALKIRSRLATPADEDLRDSDLQGKDLSHRDLSGTDLTRANLTGATLTGTNLTRARLTDAVLVAARLDGAVLVGADLSGADLRRAWLSRADLTDATTSDRTRWSRAALIDVTGAPYVAGTGAAVAPGAPIEAELAPASIGVRHSFDPVTDGLPQVVAYSPDGDTFAIGSEEGGVLVCDAGTGRPVRTLQGHHGRVSTVAYGGSVLVSGAGDGTVRIWAASSGAHLRTLPGHRGRPWPLVIDPAGTVVATGDADGTVRLWDVAGRTPPREMASAAGALVSLGLHGSWLAAAYRDGGVRLWDLTTGADRLLPAGSVSRLAFAADGRLLFTGGCGGELRAWGPTDGELVHELAGHTTSIQALAVHPRRSLLVSGDTGGAVRLWRFDGATPPRTLAASGAAIYAVAFSPSDEIIAAGDRAGVVRLWDTNSGSVRTELIEHTGSIWPFAFRPDGSQLAISDDQRTTRLWEPRTGKCLHTLAGHQRRVSSVRFSSSGSLLATSGNDGRVRLWDTADGRQLRLLPESGDELPDLRDATFSPAGPQLAMVGGEGRISVLDTATGRYERHLQVPSAPIWAIAFSASGEQLATANDDDTVGVWYHPTGQLVHTLGQHKGRVRSIAFSPDGALIATGCDDFQVRLWDARSGELRRTLTGHRDRVYSVSFGPGTLASASWDGTAVVWDLASGRAWPPLTRHTGRLWATAFHPSGTLLATAGDDLAIRLWRLEGGDCEYLYSVGGHTRRVSSLSFSPNGELLASAGTDGTARLWTIGGDPPARPRATLLGLPHGWAALAPDGRYKTLGTVRGEFWHVIGTCRFEIGELNGLVSGIRHVPVTAPL